MKYIPSIINDVIGCSGHGLHFDVNAKPLASFVLLPVFNGLGDSADEDPRSNIMCNRRDHFGLRITDQKSWEETIARENLTVLYRGPIQWPHNTSWYVTDPTLW